MALWFFDPLGATTTTIPIYMGIERELDANGAAVGTGVLITVSGTTSGLNGTGSGGLAAGKIITGRRRARQLLRIGNLRRRRRRNGQRGRQTKRPQSFERQLHDDRLQIRQWKCVAALSTASGIGPTMNFLRCTRKNGRYALLPP